VVETRTSEHRLLRPQHGQHRRAAEQ
jgi:hypothetical protein